MKILVTGATGFLGTHLVPLLVAQGHAVRTIARSAAGPELEGAEHLQGSLEDDDAIARALDGVEVVYHLAGLVSFRPKDARRMYQLHVDATRRLLEKATRAGLRRFILASTSGTIAVSRTDRTLDEDAPYPIDVVGRWPYYASKIFEERMVLEHCRRHELPLVVLNPSLLLGPGDERLSSTWIVSRFLAREIPSLPTGGLSFVDVRDAAQAFVRALDGGELHGRHLLGVNMSFKDLFARLERLSGVTAPKLQLPSKLNVLGSQLLERWAQARGQTPSLDPQEVEIGEHFFYLDASKAERLLAFRARDPHETLLDTLKDLWARMPESSLPGRKGQLAELRKAR